MFRMTALALAGLLASMTPSAAQAPAGVQTAVANGLLMMVKEGVFELQHGKSIDVTDRQILVSFPKAQYVDRNTGAFQNGRFEISINGQSHNVEGGRRIDLTRSDATKTFVADTEVCVLDIVELIEAKGAAARAVMRINCQ